MERKTQQQLERQIRGVSWTRAKGIAVKGCCKAGRIGCTRTRKVENKKVVCRLSRNRADLSRGLENSRKRTDESEGPLEGGVRGINEKSQRASEL